MWILRKAVALLGSALLVALGFLLTDQPSLSLPLLDNLKSLLVVWLLVTMYGFLPALLVTGLSDLLTLPLRTARFWVALMVHLLGVWLLMEMMDASWTFAVGSELTMNLLGVLAFFAIDEGMRARQGKQP